VHEAPAAGRLRAACPGVAPVHHRVAIGAAHDETVRCAMRGSASRLQSNDTVCIMPKVQRQ
jgi:hypothetical protein